MSILQQIAVIGVYVHSEKEKLDPKEWPTTAVPIIAAPQAWIDQCKVELGEPASSKLDSIHQCEVVCDNTRDYPVLVTHDGRVIRIPTEFPGATV